MPAPRSPVRRGLLPLGDVADRERRDGRVDRTGRQEGWRGVAHRTGSRRREHAIGDAGVQMLVAVES